MESFFCWGKIFLSFVLTYCLGIVAIYLINKLTKGSNVSKSDIGYLFFLGLIIALIFAFFENMDLGEMHKINKAAAYGLLLAVGLSKLVFGELPSKIADRLFMRSLNIKNLDNEIEDEIDELEKKDDDEEDAEDDGGNV